MAAGGIDVSRRSHVVGVPARESEFRRNGTRDLRSRGGANRLGYHSSLCGPNNEYNVSTNERSSDPIERKAAKDDGLQMPPAKRRRFFPIIWDIEAKSGTPASKSIAKAEFSSSEVSAVITNGNDATTASANSSCVGVFASQSLRHASPQLKEHEMCGDFEEGQLEEEEAVQAPNLAMSRWAMDSPRDLSDIGAGAKVEVCSRNSSPESGEFVVEDSEVNRSRSSGSDGEQLESVNSMDIDETISESSGGDQSESVEDPAIIPQWRGNMLPSCRSVDEFEKLNKISEGTYGVVYRARDKKTGEIVALKRVKMNLGREDDGLPQTSLREIKILFPCCHPAIVNLKEIVMGNSGSVFMVMEYVEHDLKAIMERMKQPFSTSEVKCLMLQLLEGVKYLHHNWVIHRDLKPSNLLLNNNGDLKICDFGMSRFYGSPLKPYTQLVVTQWYRAPELLLGTKLYSTAIDMWSIGCIMAEFLSKKPLFEGRGGSEIDQLRKIFYVLGKPNEKIWPGFSDLPGARAHFPEQPYNLLRRKFPAASFTGSPVLSDLGLDLLNKLLTYDPEKRITVDEALDHDWFREVPLPKSEEFMPTFPPRRG